MTRVERVREAIDEIYKIYGFQGESGTEELMYLLNSALISVQGDIREDHEDCLFTDCVSSLARHLDEEFVLANGISV